MYLEIEPERARAPRRPPSLTPGTPCLLTTWLTQENREFPLHCPLSKTLASKSRALLGKTQEEDTNVGSDLL